jgi:hypothetical protein
VPFLIFPFFFFGIFAFAIAGFVFWILKLVEIAGIPDHQFRAAHTDKVMWILVVAITGWIGALIWQLARRSAVLAMAGFPPPPPAGWYPDPSAPGAMRWWDGTQWTAHQSAPPPATS